MAGEEKKAEKDNAGKSQQPAGRKGKAATATARDPSVNPSLPGGGEEKKAAEDKAGKSQQPVASTATTMTAGDSDSSVNSSLPGGARPPMASFPRLAAAAASSSMNYNVQQLMTKAIPGHGQTGHQHGDTLGTQQRRNADTNEAARARLRRGRSDASVAAAAGNLKRQRLEQQGDFGFGYGQPPPPLPQQRDARRESRDQRMSGSFSQSSSAAPRNLIVLDPEPQSPTAIPGHSQTGHQHGMLGQQQRRNADTNAAATARAADAANVKHQMLHQQGNFAFGYWPQQPPPVGYWPQQPPLVGYLQQGPSSAGLPLLPMAAQAPRTLNLLDPLAPLKCLACKIMPVRMLPYPDTMHHCVCEGCFRAGISCRNCHHNINLGQSSSSAALPQMLPQAGQASSQPTAAKAPETQLCWSCNIRSAPWTTYYPNVQEHSCVCETCFYNGSTACPLCLRHR